MTRAISRHPLQTTYKSCQKKKNMFNDANEEQAIDKCKQAVAFYFSIKPPPHHESKYAANKKNVCFLRNTIPH